MALFTREEMDAACALVHQYMPPTPQYVWPQLCAKLGTKIWVKHENHTPAGAFKIRGGITFIDWLKRTQPDCKGIITATRGNHGQSQARAATAAGMVAKIMVPHGNSPEKNAAMRAFGAEVVEHGNDFDEARLEAIRLSEVESLVPVPAFNKEIARGVSTYAYELFTAAPELDVVYVSIGCGSGVCGVITIRDMLGLKTEVVGVVADEAQAAKLSVEANEMIATPTANTFADGMAVRMPVAEAFDIYSKGMARIVSVSDDEIANAIRTYFTDTHNVAEGAGAASLAAALQERDKLQGKNVAVILSGGNIDADMFADILQGNTPKAS